MRRDVCVNRSLRFSDLTAKFMSLDNQYYCKETRNLENPVVDGKVILKWMCEGIDWFQLD